MITIVDYQMGNLRSVQKGFERVGHAATVSNDPEVIRKAERLVLPGVGAFEDAMTELRARDLIEPIREVIAQDRPFLGICLGLQLLFDIGLEGGRHEGLGIIPGEVVRFDLPAEYKVPHMGWNQVRIRRPSPLLAGLSESPYFYFVHSYYVVPNDPEWIALEADYPDPFCAAVARGRLFATQFHPEKSQRNGLQLLRNFAEAV